MFGFIAIIGIGLFTVFSVSNLASENSEPNAKTKQRIKMLWEVAQKTMRTHKYLPAEKALLTIIKLDHKNAPAYNRLGILYAKQKEHKDALQCFEIASSIDPKPSSLHNLGLLYYETGKYEKASVAFEQALDKEPVATRYIAFAKVLNKLGDKKGVIKALENAVNLESNPQTLSLLAEAYVEAGDVVAAEETRSKIEEVVIPETKVVKKRRQMRM